MSLNHQDRSFFHVIIQRWNLQALFCLLYKSSFLYQLIGVNLNTVWVSAPEYPVPGYHSPHTFFHLSFFCSFPFKNCFFSPRVPHFSRAVSSICLMRFPTLQSTLDSFNEVILIISRYWAFRPYAVRIAGSINAGSKVTRFCSNSARKRKI